MEYTTTNIRLRKKDLQKIKFAALQRHTSVSALLRGLVRDYVSVDYTLNDTPTIQLWDLPKYAIKTGKKKLSSQIDDIVYGG